MITTITTSVHVLVTLFLFVAAVLTILASPRSRKHQAISLLLGLYGFASIAFGLELNAISVNQARPWIILELISVYGSAPAAFLVTLIILRPKAAEKLYVSIPVWVFILLPAILTLLDLSSASQTFFSSNLLINFEELRQTYSGGYIAVIRATTGLGVFILLAQLIFFYMLTIVYPTLVVTIRDRNTDPRNQRNALILFVSTTLGTIVSSVFRDSLPLTIAPMLTNLILSTGFFIVAMRLNMQETDKARDWINRILGKYSMFSKLLGTMALIVLPTVIFIAFTTYSYFQNSLLTIANSNLQNAASREAKILLSDLADEIHVFQHLNESSRIRTQLNNRLSGYQGMPVEQIQQQISTRQQQWQSNDLLLISTTLDPVNNNELRNFLTNNPDFADVVLADGYGALVTANQNPLNYDFSGADWWQHLAVSQSTYIGPIIWDDTRQQYTTEIAIPIFDAGEAFIGGLKTTYTLTSLFTEIAGNPENQIKYGFITPTGTLIPTRGVIADEFTLPQSFTDIQANSTEWKTFEVQGVSSLIRTISVSDPQAEYNTQWNMLAYQPVSQALNPLVSARIATTLSGLLIITMSIFIVIGLAQSITKPLNVLTEAASNSFTENPDILVELDSTDEIGTLATSFNAMRKELNSLVQNLEETIENRTGDLQRRATQLEASAVVAREAAEVRDLTRLLDLAVNLIPEKFGYYHAGIFMVDEQNRYAILQAANSEGGKRMLARGHRLQVGRVGVVGYCAGTGKPRIAQDVGSDIVYYDNPDMPNTRSEMALPLEVRDKVIGVLDVQSEDANAFRQEDIEVLQVLADQIALAIDNAQLLESSQHALEELQILYSQEAANAWRQKLTGQKFSYQYDSTGITRKAMFAAQQETETIHALSKPITFRGQVIGNLDFIRDEQEQNWSEDEIELIEEILEQTALALENARLVDQIRLRSDQIQLLQEITAMAASILEEKELLSNVAQKLQTNLQIQHCGIALRAEDSDILELIASAAKVKDAPTIGTSLSLPEDDLSLSIFTDQTIKVYKKYTEEPSYQAFVQTFATKGGSTLIFLPLTIREDVVGYIFLEDADVHRVVDEEETNLFQQVAAQISTAIESARLFAAEQEGRLAAAALLEITQIASASLDMNRVLNRATNRSAQAIQAHRCSIFLLDEKEKLKPLISVYADGQPLPPDEWQLLQEKIQSAYQDVPLRTLAASLRSPRIIQDPLGFTTLPLGWVEAFQIKSLLLVPLISQNKVIGSMIYDQTNPAIRFRQNQVEIAQTIAGQIATTIENSKLFEQAVLRAERERQVTEITAKIRSSNDPDVIMETAISELRAALTKPNPKVELKPTSTTTSNTPPAHTNGKQPEDSR